MSIKKQKVYNVIETLPEGLMSQVIDFIKYLKLTHVNADSIIIKSKKI